MSKNNKIYNLKIIKAGELERYKYYELAYVIPDNGGKTGIRGQAKDREESIRRAMHRAKEKIYGYVIANDWEYWATQTFNREVVDRYNLDEIVKRYNQKLYNLRKRSYSELKWLIVPEQHKDGAWHLHMFMSGIPKDRIKYSGRDYYNKEKQFTRPIYNWVDTIDYGYNDYLYIGNIEPLERVKMANYVTKYITKELVKKRFNRKMYWASRGLWEPNVASTYVYDVETIMSSGTIITQNTYNLKDPESGEIFNTVHDFTLHYPCPF